jgi:hypothetical protein
MAETCAEIKSRLDAAQAAYDALLAGGAVRSITDSDGSRIEYTSANLPSLVSRLALLTAQYNACLAGTGTVVTKPVNFFF